MPKRKVNLKKFSISQSKLRDYFRIPGPTRDGGSGKYNEPMCGLVWWNRYIKGERSNPSLVMKKGLYFEHHLIGAARGGQEPPRLTDSVPKQTATGKWKIGNQSAHETIEEAWANYVAPAETELDEFLVKCKKIFRSLKIKKKDVQPEWIDTFNGITLESHVDLMAEFKGKESIIDIKYTETRHDHRWDGGWGAPEYMPNTTFIQPVHYAYHDWERSGRPVDDNYEPILKPFYYLVFGHTGTKGKKKLWSKMIEVKVTTDHLIKHIESIQTMADELKTWTPQPINDFNVCQNCQFAEKCNKRTKTPVIEVVEANY